MISNPVNFLTNPKKKIQEKKNQLTVLFLESENVYRRLNLRTSRGKNPPRMERSRKRDHP